MKRLLAWTSIILFCAVALALVAWVIVAILIVGNVAADLVLVLAMLTLLAAWGVYHLMVER
jgi:hypothetical protein